MNWNNILDGLSILILTGLVWANHRDIVKLQKQLTQKEK